MLKKSKHVEIMNGYSISPINPFWVGRRISNNGVTIQHYLLFHKDRIHIKAYFPLEILKAGNTLLCPPFGFLPRVLLGHLCHLLLLGFWCWWCCLSEKKWEEDKWAYLHCGIYTAHQHNQTKSPASCNGVRIPQRKEAYEQGSYTTDLKQPHPG